MKRVGQTLSLVRVDIRLGGGILAVLALAMLGGGCTKTGPVPPHSVSGTIETDEAHVASRYGGRVEKIFAQEGESLKAGQPLVELDATELRARRDLAGAQLAEYEAGARPQELDTAKHDWETLQAELAQAQTDAKRATDLFAQRTISVNDNEQAQTRVRMLEQRTAAAKSRYDLLVAGTRAERIAQAKAQVAEIDAQLAEMKIVAPTDSVLEILNVKPGDVLAANREVATLMLTNHLWVRVYVPEPWLGRITLGEQVKVRVDSDPGRDFSGTVEQIARSAEFTPRNVQTVGERAKQVFGIKVRLDPAQGVLRAGMSADVTFANVPK